MESVSDSCRLFVLPYELVHIIYNYLTLVRDVIRLASTCKQMRHNVPDEITRVLGIRKRYIDINKSIRSIKYFISDRLCVGYAKRSIRISANDVKMYANTRMSISEDTHTWPTQTAGGDLFVINGQKTFLRDYLFALPPSKYNIDNCFSSNKEEIYKLLEDKEKIIIE